jgi:signal transduction histidine kinase
VALTALAVDGYNKALQALIAFGVTWVLGDSLGTRRAYTRALEERAERLERERERESARAVAEEQARIARELHDVIAHNLSVMVVQAAANDVFDARPDRAREALQTIEATGRGALAELRRLLGGVRGDGADFAPQPDLAQLDELIDQVRAAGLQVVLHVDGEPRPLPAALELSAYRIVQEALTNTLKHAHASRADVALRYRAEALDVEIRDDGTGNGDAPAGGHGLIGMRERVGIFGGSLDAGPVPGGGFAIAARFPSAAGA